MLKEASIRSILMAVAAEMIRKMAFFFIERVVLAFGSVGVALVYPMGRVVLPVITKHVVDVLFGRCFRESMNVGKGRPTTWRDYVKSPAEIYRTLTHNFHRLVQYAPFSKEKLAKAENALLETAMSEVDISRHMTPVFAHIASIHSISVTGRNPAIYDPHKIPLVLLHELGAGVGYWSNNIAAFGSRRPTYALDLFGFGQSERIRGFPDCADTAEEWFVKSVEEWRVAMGIEKMILLGHRLGGYVAASYALQFPQRVRHLILCEPWGFVEKPAKKKDDWVTECMPSFYNAVPWVMSKLNGPLDIVRLTGHLGIGPLAISTQNPNLGLNVCPRNPRAAFQYLHQVNADHPTGEIVYAKLSHNNWAINPMNKRILDLDSSVPISFLLSDHGNQPLEEVVWTTRCWRKERNMFTIIQHIRSGTRPNIQNPRAFNNDVLVICKIVDFNADQRVFPLDDHQHNHDSKP